MYLLAKLLFPKTINRLESEKAKYQQLAFEKNTNISELKQRLELTKKEDEIFRRILSNEVKDYSSLKAFKRDKNGRECFVIDIHKTMLMIYQVRDNLDSYYHTLHINYEIKIDYKRTVLPRVVEYLWIHDIVNHENNANKGLGSIAMEELIKIARRLNCSYIKGELSHEDSDNKERRFHFYEKFGFKIHHYSGDKIKNPYMYASVKLEL